MGVPRNNAGRPDMSPPLPSSGGSTSFMSDVKKKVDEGSRRPMAWMSAKGQLAPVLAVIAVATVAAVAVIATHTSGPGPAALMPRPFVKNGVRMVPHRIYELPAGKVRLEPALCCPHATF